MAPLQGPGAPILGEAGRRLAACVERTREQGRSCEGLGQAGSGARGTRGAGVSGAGLTPGERERGLGGDSWVQGWRLTTEGLPACPRGSGELWSTLRQGPARPPVRRSLRAVWPHGARRGGFCRAPTFTPPTRPAPRPPAWLRPLSPDGNLRRRVRGCGRGRGGSGQARGGGGRQGRSQVAKAPRPPPPPLRRCQTARGGGRGGGRRRRAGGARAPGRETGGPPLRLGKGLQARPGRGKMRVLRPLALPARWCATGSHCGFQPLSSHTPRHHLLHLITFPSPLASEISPHPHSTPPSPSERIPGRPKEPG